MSAAGESREDKRVKGIQKLNSIADLPDWRYSIRSLLVSMDIDLAFLDHIFQGVKAQKVVDDGAILIKTEKEHQDEYALDRKKVDEDQKLQGPSKKVQAQASRCIYLTVCKAIQAEIRVESDESDLRSHWRVAINHFSRKTVRQQETEYNDFFQLKKEKGESFHDFVIKIKTARESINAMGNDEYHLSNHKLFYV